MDKQIRAHPYMKYFSAIKWSGLFHTAVWTNLRNMISERSQIHIYILFYFITPHYSILFYYSIHLLFHLYEISRIVQSMETESKLVFARRAIESNCLIGKGFILGDEMFQN